MGQWNELTEDQQNAIKNFVDVLLRPLCGEQSRVINHWNAANTDYNAQTNAALNLLDGDVEIPNEGGLVGAATLTKDQIVTIVSHGQGILTAYDTPAHRQLWSNACGPQNTIG